jgi:3-isopropylmalate dehydrogenase
MMRVALLPGDGVGPEVIGAARGVLEALGGLDVFEAPTPAACRGADAVLAGPFASGSAVAELERALTLFARLRPARPLRGLAERSPLGPERAAAMDVLVVSGSGAPASLAAVAATAARRRRGHVTWCGPFAPGLAAHDNVVCEPATAEALAGRLASAPVQLDVILCPAAIAGVLAAVADALTGVPEVQAQAWVGPGPGVFSPAHGPEPRARGRPASSPVGTLLAAALMLRHGLGLEEPARRLERALDTALAAGLRTPELAAGEPGERPANTLALVSHVLAALRPAPVSA